MGVPKGTGAPVLTQVMCHPPIGCAVTALIQPGTGVGDTERQGFPTNAWTCTVGSAGKQPCCISSVITLECPATALTPLSSMMACAEAGPVIGVANTSNAVTTMANDHERMRLILAC